MKFWRKFWFFALTIALFVFLQLFAKEVGRLEFSICGRDFSVGMYLISIAVLSFWLTCFCLKSFFVWFISLFFKNKTAEEIKSINSLARLIVANDCDFRGLFEKLFITENLKILKVALALKRGLCTDKSFEKTGTHCVDILIIKRELGKFLDEGDLPSALNLATKTIANYPEELHVIQNEILETAKLARRNMLAFSFEPSKFKYNLPNCFVEKYHISIGLVDFELEGEHDRRIKILEKLHRDYPANVDILCRLLDFAGSEYTDKKILKTIEETISMNPNKKVAPYLTKLNRSDIMEISQTIMSEIPETNLEKLWILLIIAVTKKFTPRCRELLSKIAEQDKSSAVVEFFVDHFEFLSSDPEIVEIIKSIREKNENKI